MLIRNLKVGSRKRQFSAEQFIYQDGKSILVAGRACLSLYLLRCAISYSRMDYLGLLEVEALPILSDRFYQKTAQQYVIFIGQ
jgi:hypothetical protein